MPLVWLVLLEGYRLGIDLPALEFSRLARAGAWLWAIMPAGYRTVEPGRARLMGLNLPGEPWVFREVPEYRRVDGGCLECVLCGYRVPIELREKHGRDHRFHYGDCLWTQSEPPADALIAAIRQLGDDHDLHARG